MLFYEETFGCLFFNLSKMTFLLSDDETKPENVNQQEDEDRSKEVTKKNQVLENADQDGDAHDSESVAEDNLENIEAVEENGQAEGPISYVDNPGEETYLPGLEYETQPGPTGYYTQNGEMIYLNIAEDGQMIYQTEDGRLVYQYPDEDGRIIYHTGGVEVTYDAENPSAIVEDAVYDDEDDDGVTAAEADYNLVSLGSILL